MAKSAFGNLLPLIILFVVLCVVIAIGYVAYSIATDVAGNTQKRMEEKNITFSREGMKVGVKEVTREQQEDSTQNLIMKVWNNSSWPAYKSKLGWGDSKSTSRPGISPSSSGLGTEKRKPYLRTSSNQTPATKS